jgi:hypothetical protein
MSPRPLPDMSQHLTILGSSLTALAVARDAHALGLLYVPAGASA